MATFKNPGYLKTSPNINFQQLLSETDPYNICADCQVIRTPRSRHWNICNKCVERFDHHWPYLNNCIGYRNHFYFLCFIIVLMFSMAYLAGLTLYTLIEGHPTDGWSFMNEYPLVNKILYYAFWTILLVVWTFFLCFVGILTVVHCINFCKNRTTNERFSQKHEENSSFLSRSITDNTVTDISAYQEDNTSTNVRTDSMLRTTFMGPKNGNWIVNCFR